MDFDVWALVEWWMEYHDSFILFNNEAKIKKKHSTHFKTQSTLYFTQKK